jgi:hypothetical protein
MGVKGLLSYLKSKKAAKKVNLNGLALAVDGYALILFLQKKYNLHSNDLAQFYRIAEYYLNVFRKNSVKLWVVFDGLSPSDKTKEKYRRRQKSWNRVMGILEA